ncbi:DUF1214 domain-containing protein [Pigmentibacter ruber]
MFNRKYLNSIFIIFCNLFIILNSSAIDNRKLSDAEIENVINRSYQYVALYNVINKNAIVKVGDRKVYSWNSVFTQKELTDQSDETIARPNNDTLYSKALLDLSNDAVVLHVPVINSKYVSLETSAYDHYMNVPLSNLNGDYTQPLKILFYTSRTKSYKAGKKIRGIDKYIEMSGDFIMAMHRVMPHANDPDRFEIIKNQMAAIKAEPLSQYLGKKIARNERKAFPEVGYTDADIFGKNLLEVMQFVFNHTSFDKKKYSLDDEVLKVYKKLGIEPGKKWNPELENSIDHKKFKEISLKVQLQQTTLSRDQGYVRELNPYLFQPKGTAGIEVMLFQSVFGPFGLPIEQAVYPPVNTADRQPLNALNDYVIRIKKDDLPPAKSFWSFTLYDSLHGYFIPNEYKKYSVGLNSGYKLNSEGGIEIYISEKKPANVPLENWLPINRVNQNLDILLRIYEPDLEKIYTWTAPVVELLKNEKLN